MCQQHTHIHATTVMRVRELLRGALQSGGDGHVWRTQTNRYRERESSGDPTVTTCCREASQNSNATLHTRGAVHCIPVAPTICQRQGFQGAIAPPQSEQLVPLRRKWCKSQHRACPHERQHIRSKGGRALPPHHLFPCQHAPVPWLPVTGLPHMNTAALKAIARRLPQDAQPPHWGPSQHYSGAVCPRHDGQHSSTPTASCS